MTRKLNFTQLLFLLIFPYLLSAKITDRSTFLNSSKAELNSYELTTIYNSNLYPGNTYSLKKRAKDEAGNYSDYRDIINVTTLTDSVPPTDPTNLTYSNVSSTSVDLNWEGSTDENQVYYKIYKNGLYSDYSSGQTSKTLEGLIPETEYTFFIKAYDISNNESGKSNEITITTLSNTTPPTIPSDVVASNVSNTSVVLNWTPSTDDVGVSNYIVLKDGNIIAAPTSNSINISELLPASNYIFTVKAADAIGNISEASEPLNITTLADTIAPSVPDSLKVSNISAINADLNWFVSTDNIGVTFYLIYQDNILIDSTQTNSFHATGLTAETAYNFSVKATDLAGNISDASNNASITTPIMDTESPSIPNELTAIENSTFVDISWVASSDNVGVAEYEIFQNGTYLASTNSIFYTAENLSLETEYTFTVKAKDLVGNVSEQSEPIKVTTLPDIEAPSQPIGIAGLNITEQSVDLSWAAATDNIGVASYEVYQNGILINSVSTLSLQINGLLPSTLYEFTVKAKDLAGNISEESMVAFVPTRKDNSSPSLPTNITASNITATAVDLNWTASTDNIGVEGYDIYIGNSYNIIASSATNSVKITGLTAATVYNFIVKAKDAAGNIAGSYQSSISFTTAISDETPTVLTPGDIAIIGLKADSPDNFHVLFLTNISGSTQISFTDNAWLPESEIFRDGENTYTYIVPDGGHPAGTVLSADEMNIGLKSYDLSNGGDQITVYQGETNIFTATSHSLVFQSTDSDANDSNRTGLPIGLSEGITAVAAGLGSGLEDEWDNIYYTGSLDYGTKAELLNAIAGSANWTGDNSSYFPKTTFTVLNAPDLSVSTDSLIFGSIINGSKSAPKTFKLSGSGLINDIIITAPEYFEISKDGGETFSNSLTIPFVEANEAEQSIDVRFSPSSASNGLITGNIKLKSFGAISELVAVNGTETGNDDEPPTAPENLVASDISYTTVSLNWDASTDNEGVKSYEIFKNGSFLVEVFKNSHNVTELIPNRSYEFTVKAKDDAENNSSASNSVNITMLSDTERPSTPGDLTVISVSANSAILTWTPSTDNVEVFNYIVYNNYTEFMKSTSTNSLQLTNLKPSTLYNLTVKAYDSPGFNFSSASNEVKVFTAPFEQEVNEIFFSEYVDGYGSNKALEIANYTTEEIDLSNYSIRTQSDGAGSWGEELTLSGILSNEDVFVIVNSNAQPDMVSFGDLVSDADAVNFDGNDPIGLFKNGELIDIIGKYNGGSTSISYGYTLRKRSERSFPTTNYSLSEWNYRIENTFDGLGWHNTDIHPPTKPINLTASEITTGSVKLDWERSYDNSGVKTYNIMQDGEVVGSSEINSFNVTDLSENTEFSFVVQAKDNVGNLSPISSSIKVKTLEIDREPPTIPTDVTATNIDITSIELSWTPSTDNTGVSSYIIYRDNYYLGQSSTNTYSVTGLSPETTYTFIIRARDARWNISSGSIPTEFTTLNDTIAPTAPADLLASNITTNTLDLSWTAATDNIGVTAYDIFQDDVLIDSSENTTYNVTGLAPGTNYSFYVRTRDVTDNISEKSETLFISTIFNTTENIFINEVDADQRGVDRNEFVELYDGGIGNTSLDGFVLVFYNGSSRNSYTSFDLDGKFTNENGFFVIGSATVPNVGMIVESGTNILQNGSDAVALYIGNSSDFPNGTNITTNNLIDAMVYDTNDGDNMYLLALLNDGQPQINEDELGDKDYHSNSRVPDGGVLRNSDTFTQVDPSPGWSNNPSIITTSVETLDDFGNVDNGSHSSFASYTITGSNLIDDLIISAPEYFMISQDSGENFFEYLTLSPEVLNDKVKTIHVRFSPSSGINGLITDNIAHESSRIETVEVVVSGTETNNIDLEDPSAPTNLTATNITYSSVDLSWTAATDNYAVTGYNIYQDDQLIDSTTANTYQVTGLAVASSYDFAVKAKDEAGNLSHESNIISVSTLEDTEAPTTPSNLTALNISATFLNLNWTESSDNIKVSKYEIFMGDDLIGSSESTTFKVPNLSPSTPYVFFLRAKDASGNLSEYSNLIQVSTLDQDYVPDLFFAEYVEGAANNKALEIANLTAETKDLSQYSIMTQNNGTGDWGNELNLTGTLNSNDVFVIGHSNADEDIINVADLTTTAPAISFDGNDPIGLFKNGVLIDIIGTVNGGHSDFAKDVTLRRKTEIVKPNTNFYISEWNSFVLGNFDGLGSHIISIEIPEAPSALQVDVISATQIDLTWTDNTAVETGFIIQRSNIENQFSGATEFQIPSNGSSYSDVSVDGGTTYYYRLKAVNEHIPSDFSNVVNAVTPCDIPSSVTIDNILDNQAVINFNAVSGATNYQIQYRIVGVPASSVMINRNSNNTEISGLSAGTNYEIRVRSFCPANGVYSDYSPFQSFTTTGSIACNSPSIISIDYILDNSININWAAVQGAESYEIQYRLEGIPTSSIILNNVTNSTTVSGLDSGTDYEIRIKTVCDAGSLYSEYSDFISFKTTGAAACNTPSGISISNILDSSIDFSWSAVAGASSYKIQYRVKGIPSSAKYLSINGNSTPISGLYTGTDYEIRIQTVCTDGTLYSDYSGFQTFTTTGSVACDIPSGVVLSNLSDNNVDVSWGTVAGAISYQIQYREYGNPSTNVFLNSNTNNVDITGLNPGTNYEIRVKTVCSDRQLYSGYSGFQSFTTTGSVAKIKTMDNNPEITDTNLALYPNPSEGKINIKKHSDNVDLIRVLIYNTVGTLVHQSEYMQTIDTQVDLKRFGSGMYIVKVLSDGIVETKKVVIR